MLAILKKNLNPCSKPNNCFFILFSLFTLIYVIIRSFKYSSHFKIFTVAGATLVSGQNPFNPALYAGEVGIWKYSDLTAVFFYPFSLFPESLGRFLFYSLSAGLLIYGIYLFLKILDAFNFPFYIFVIVFILFAGDFFISVKDAKIEVLLTAFCLLSCYLLYKEKAFWGFTILAFATALKFYPIAFAGLAIIAISKGNFKQILKWGTLYLSLTLIFFFLPLFISGQKLFFQNLAAQAQIHSADMQGAWKAFLSIYAFFYKAFSIELTGGLQKLISITAGLFLAVLTFIKSKKSADKFLLPLCLSSASLYFILFNHLTQSNSYVALIPSYIFFFICFLQREKKAFLYFFFLAWFLIILLGSDASPQVLKELSKTYLLKVLGSSILFVLSTILLYKQAPSKNLQQSS